MKKCRGLKNGRAEGEAAEADGKDVLEEWWRVVASGGDLVVQQVVMTALGWERSRNTKRARDKVTSAGETTAGYSLS